MKLNNRYFNTSFILISLLFCLACFTGCNTRAEQKSLTDQFITIDALIRQNQMGSAIKELKKAEKRVYDPWSYLGVFKRYIEIGENDAADKIISKAVKSYNKNIELAAVYTNYLIKMNRLDDAEVQAKKLINTEYSSLFSEVVLRQSLLASENDNFDFYTNKDFYNVFYNAYNVSKNPMWIRNCGVFDLIQGRYERIGDLAPSTFSDADDAYFWGLALYDAGKYYESIDALLAAQDFLESYSKNVAAQFKATASGLVALISDGYMCVADMEMAEKARQELIFDLASGINITDPLMPIIMTNSAIWAYNNNFYDECADLLFFIVNNWPDYVPGLVLYSNFAYNSNLQRQENSEMTALRDAGIATIEMEKYDSRRKIPISDAKYRVDEALKRTSNPYLNIVQLDLKYKLDPSLNINDKYRDIWNMMEDSYNVTGEYKSLLVQYALNSLLLNKEFDQGWKLFYNFVTSVSDFDEDLPFWEQFVENISLYDLGIAEFGGLFATHFGLIHESLRILEYCVYESSGILEDGLISQNVSSASCMNLADVYFSLGREDKALDLYGRIGGRESSKSIRSDVFYRIACIYNSIGDIKNALRSTEYACTLYPDNVRASLLKDKLKL